MTYATDGKCHNANRGTFGHECGKPATWIGTNKRTGFRSGYCDHCKEYGDEAQYCDEWESLNRPQWTPATARQRVRGTFGS